MTPDQHVTAALEPHLWAALVLAVIVIASLGYLYWRYYR